MRTIGTTYEDVRCACGAAMVLRQTKRGDFAGRIFYGCSRYPACRELHGAHQQTGLPKGICGDKETRQARIEAHEAFDRIWRNGELKRNHAYKWLAEQLGIECEACHIGSFDKAMCARVVDVCTKDKEQEKPL